MTLLVAVLIAVGVVGTVVPLVPGLVLVWGATLVFGLSEGFGSVGAAAFAAITVLCAAGVAAGVVVPSRAARSGGAARSSLLLGALLGVVGFFVVPVVGLPLGAVLGIWLGERARTGDAALARQATWATVKGFGVATLLQLAAGLASAVAWIPWALTA